MSVYIDLVKKTIEEYLNNEKLPDTKKLPAELLKKRAACFVSIHTKSNELRGCIGTIVPLYKNIGSEIIANSVEAAFRDPRFPPIKKDELKNLKYSVDILSEPEKIATQKELDPKKFGVIVKTIDGRTGLLLPDLEGIDKIDEQLTIAREKGNIESREEIELYRFSSQRFD
jgi:AmmeMemoRadiSam system protein A